MADMISLLGGTFLLAAAPAPADTSDPSAHAAPAVYRQECGSCHVAFPPGMLAADHWRTLMAGLSRHFGENAEVAEPARREIEDFLVGSAGGTRRFASRSEPPRLTTTTWFRRTHGATRPLFTDKRVGSAANCLACHPGAETGRYDGLAPWVRHPAH